MIYLDHAATTPLDARVLVAMEPWLDTYFGNPSSLHAAGRRARAAVEEARERVAAWIGGKPSEVVFTSGGSESNSFALLGLAAARQSRGRHVISTPIEHPSVLHCLDRLAGEGFEIEYLAVDNEGLIDPDELASKLRSDTILVSVMAANNEIGVMLPLAKVAEICAERRVPLHVDAVQSLVEARPAVRAQRIGLLTGSAHKLHGPKGIGFLYIASGLRPEPRTLGGPQERRRRAGTENVAGIVGLAAAIELLDAEQEQRRAHCLLLRERLIDGLLALPGTRLNGSRSQRLANNANVSFEGVHGEALMLQLDQAGICVATGSACSSGSTDPSHVLQALGGDLDLAHGSLRFTVGPANTVGEIDEAVRVTARAVADLRALRPH